MNVRMDPFDTRQFFVLGAMKCGTTSLYFYLEQHPDICISDPKEPIFFEAQFEQGLPFYRERNFAHWRNEPVTGDAQARHLGLPFVPERIHEAFPDALLIAILRNPVERAYSEWWHRYSRGREPLPFRAAIDANLERLASGRDFSGDAGIAAWREGLRAEHAAATRFGLYLDLGYYARQIERYDALFPREQLRLILFEDLVADPVGVTQALWKFLGVAADHPVSESGRFNEKRAHVQSPLRAHISFLRTPPLIRRAIPDALRVPWRRFLRGRAQAQPPLEPETEAFLLDHFAPHNRGLEERLGRALPDWFRPRSERNATPPGAHGG